MTALRTLRFALRRPLRDDLALYCRLYTNEDTMRHVAPAWSQAQAEASFAKVLAADGEARFRYRLWVVVPHGGEPAGLLALTGDAARAELGMMVLPEWRGRGMAQEVVPCVAAYAFATLGIGNVATRHVPSNVAGARVMEALGFRPEPRTEDGWEAWSLSRPG